MKSPFRHQKDSTKGGISHHSFRKLKLTTFPSLNKYMQFESLSFSDNPIKSFHDLPVLPNLKELYLDNTQIESFKDCRPQPSLHSVSLKSTQLSRMPLINIMCSIAFGNSIRFVNGVAIKKEDYHMSEFLRPKLVTYLQSGWLLMSIDELRLFHSETRERRILKINGNIPQLNKDLPDIPETPCKLKKPHLTKSTMRSKTPTVTRTSDILKDEKKKENMEKKTIAAPQTVVRHGPANKLKTAKSVCQTPTRTPKRTPKGTPAKETKADKSKKVSNCIVSTPTTRNKTSSPISNTPITRLRREIGMESPYVQHKLEFDEEFEVEETNIVDSIKQSEPVVSNDEVYRTPNRRLMLSIATNIVQEAIRFSESDDDETIDKDKTNDPAINETEQLPKLEKLIIENQTTMQLQLCEQECEHTEEAEAKSEEIDVAPQIIEDNSQDMEINEDNLIQENIEKTNEHDNDSEMEIIERNVEVSSPSFSIKNEERKPNFGKQRHISISSPMAINTYHSASRMVIDQPDLFQEKDYNNSIPLPEFDDILEDSIDNDDLNLAYNDSSAMCTPKNEKKVQICMSPAVTVDYSTNNDDSIEEFLKNIPTFEEIPLKTAMKSSVKSVNQLFERQQKYVSSIRRTYNIPMKQVELPVIHIEEDTHIDNNNNNVNQNESSEEDEFYKLMDEDIDDDYISTCDSSEQASIKEIIFDPIIETPVEKKSHLPTRMLKRKSQINSHKNGSENEIPNIETTNVKRNLFCPKSPRRSFRKATSSANFHGMFE